jgi:hypothetical protein
MSCVELRRVVEASPSPPATAICCSKPYHCRWSTAFFRDDVAAAVGDGRIGANSYDLTRHRHLALHSAAGLWNLMVAIFHPDECIGHRCLVIVMRKLRDIRQLFGLVPCEGSDAYLNTVSVGREAA